MDLTLGCYPHRHPVSISAMHFRFETLAVATETLAALIFSPPRLPDAVQQKDTLDAAQAFQIAIGVVLRTPVAVARLHSERMYGFWCAGNWQAYDWGEYDEVEDEDALCFVSFLVSLFFDEDWIAANFDNTQSAHSPRERVDLMVNSESGPTPVGLSFVRQWWVQKKTAIKCTSA